jgi:antitoxin CptB
MDDDTSGDTGARQQRIRKLSFRAWRRGFKEADIILGHFSDEALPTMSDAELDTFEVLLEVPDQDLYGWIIERDPTPKEFQSEIMRRLNTFYKTAYKHL